MCLQYLEGTSSARVDAQNLQDFEAFLNGLDSITILALFFRAFAGCDLAPLLAVVFSNKLALVGNALYQQGLYVLPILYAQHAQDEPWFSQSKWDLARLAINDYLENGLGWHASMLHLMDPQAAQGPAGVALESKMATIASRFGVFCKHHIKPLDGAKAYGAQLCADPQNLPLQMSSCTLDEAVMIRAKMLGPAKVVDQLRAQILKSFEEVDRQQGVVVSLMGAHRVFDLGVLFGMAQRLFFQREVLSACPPITPDFVQTASVGGVFAGNDLQVPLDDATTRAVLSGFRAWLSWADLSLVGLDKIDIM
ncbi:hypothetical protein [Helicobacter gastrocanis]|uniref:hypothetical protein n=1 Tax=Helicobacter gastrocanis TaxID=2849641 RepID=UPI001C843EF9|nr:hypothetical protein [Helicobacter sp. NHP19-003]